MTEEGVIAGGDVASALDRIEDRTGLDGLDACAFVQEALPELLDLKREVLGRLSTRVGAGAIIASTSSTIAPRHLADAVERPERFLVAHWLNPAHIVPLVEVVAGQATAAAVVDRAIEVLEALGKVPVRCADSPGFIGPRLQALLMNEAVRLVEEGVASPEDVDRAFRAGMGFRYAQVGIFEFIDWGGVDILHRATRFLADALGDHRSKPARLVEAKRAPDRVIDGRRRLVLPGFVDTHVHLSEHLNRGLLLDDIPVDRYLSDWLIPLYAVMTPEEEQVSAQLACVEMIRTGTTTFCEAGTLFDVAAVADAVEAIGMRAILGRWSWDLAGGSGRMRQTTADALRANEEMLAAVHGRAKGRIGAWPLLLGFGTCSATLMRAAKALADRYGVGWGMMHFAAHPSRKTADRIPLVELDALGVLGPNTKLAHMVYVDDADVRLLATRGVKVSHCPSAALKHTKGLVAHGRFPEMLDAGVSVSLGGDSGNGSNHFDMLRLMYLTATISKDARLDVGVMGPERVLEMATLHG